MQVTYMLTIGVAVFREQCGSLCFERILLLQLLLLFDFTTSSFIEGILQRFLGCQIAADASVDLSRKIEALVKRVVGFVVEHVKLWRPVRHCVGRMLQVRRESRLNTRLHPDGSQILYR